MKLATLVLAGSLVLTAQQAHSMTVTNTDPDAAMVTIIVGDEEMMYEVAPGETLSDLCVSGCTAIFGNGEELSLTGRETVLIEQDKPTINR